MTPPRWLERFGLVEPPFSKHIADQELWLPSSRKPIVDELVEAMADHEHVLLCGEPGVGKTCVLRALRHRLPEAGYRLTYCHNATLGRRDFYRQLCLALGLNPRATAAAVFFAISSHVEDLGRSHVHPVLLLDESHLLHQDVLEHLHVLANYEWDSAPLLSMVLVGLPELRDRLELRKNRSLYSRIHVRLDLGEATPGDTAEYIAYRTKRAGAERELYSSDAVAMLHEAALGRLRDIDRVATRALKCAARRKLKTVDRELIEHVLDEDRRDAA
ncbi:MAG TPA: AAA family ATPase [Geminicoccaceae bacterium]|nr:AAA family ATPase [Geminicoccaceae bacterium]